MRPYEEVMAFVARSKQSANEVRRVFEYIESNRGLTFMDSRRLRVAIAAVLAGSAGATMQVANAQQQSVQARAQRVLISTHVASGITDVTKQSVIQISTNCFEYTEASDGIR